MQGLYVDGAGRVWIATGAGGAARVDDPDDAAGEHTSSYVNDTTFIARLSVRLSP